MNKKLLIDTAMGREEADLVIKGGKLIDVLGHGYIEGDIAVKDGYIVGIGEYNGKEVIDASGRYIAPGFIDSHVHIESSMCTPAIYADTVIKHGVTAVVTDPHEIANVCAESGIEFMIRDAESAVTDIFFMLPSCVPATPFDNSGCLLDSEALKAIYSRHNFLGLAEMMNSPGVIYADGDVMGKLDIAERIDGHAPLLSGNALNAYICGGIGNDHECSTADEALEKVSKGLDIFIRYGTGAKNLDELIKAVTPYNMSHFAFCTDDKEICDVISEGTISACIKRAVSLGMDAVTAHTLASYNAARIFGLKGRGALAPGYIADMVIMAEADTTGIELVIKDGRVVKDSHTAAICEDELAKVTGSVHIKPVNSNDFEKRFDKKEPVIRIHKGELITTPVYRDTAEGLSLCANIERHRASGNIGLCYVEGFELQGGAVAQTIGHDSHNITVIGDNSEDMALAVNSLGQNGGICVVKDGKVLKLMELEVAGLMSCRGAEAVAEDYRELIKCVRELCIDGSSTLMMILSFISLLVIPHIKLSDRGLFDVDKFEFI